MSQRPSTEIANRRIGGDAPLFLIAEMAWAHDGEIDKALAIARGAVAARADALNIHLTSLPDYMTRDYGTGPGRASSGGTGESLYEYLERISLEAGDWKAVAKAVHDGGLALSCQCNDVESIGLACELDADVINVPPACLAEQPYLERAAAAGRPLLLGIGGATLAEIEAALEALRTGGEDRIVLQHGVQSYPTDPETLNLRYLGTISTAFDLPVIFHDHTEAGTRHASIVPLACIALGIAGIEKHVTHDRSLHGEDWESALDPGELAEFASDMRTIERALGDPAWRPLGEGELRYRDVVRKRAVARRAIRSGEPLDYDNVAFKRAEDGLDPAEFGRFIGRSAAADLEADAPIRAESIV
jgi:sialic acid synthase SpsE